MSEIADFFFNQSSYLIQSITEDGDFSVTETTSKHKPASILLQDALLHARVSLIFGFIHKTENILLCLYFCIITAWFSVKSWFGYLLYDFRHSSAAVGTFHIVGSCKRNYDLFFTWMNVWKTWIYSICCQLLSPKPTNPPLWSYSWWDQINLVVKLTENRQKFKSPTIKSFFNQQIKRNLFSLFVKVIKMTKIWNSCSCKAHKK